MELAYVLCGLTQNFDQLIVGIRGEPLDVFLGNAHQLRHQFELIEPLRIVAQRLVAAAAYILDDFVHGFIDVLLDIGCEKTVDFAQVQFSTQIHNPHRITFSSAWIS